MATLAILYRSILKNPGRTLARSDLEHFRAAKGLFGARSVPRKLRAKARPEDESAV